MPVKPVPDGYTSIAPYLFVDDGKAAIDFYKRAFGATDHGLIQTPDGRVAHGELKIGTPSCASAIRRSPFAQADPTCPESAL